MERRALQGCVRSAKEGQDDERKCRSGTFTVARGGSTGEDPIRSAASSQFFSLVAHANEHRLCCSVLLPLGSLQQLRDSSVVGEKTTKLVHLQVAMPWSHAPIAPANCNNTSFDSLHSSRMMLQSYPRQMGALGILQMAKWRNLGEFAWSIYLSSA